MTLCDVPDCTDPSEVYGMCKRHFGHGCGWVRRRDANREAESLLFRLTSLVVAGRGSEFVTLELAKEAQRLQLIAREQPPPKSPE